MLKAAVIGCGSMGRNHARIYNAMSGVQLVGLVDPGEHALDVCNMYHVPLNSDVECLLQDVHLDIVSIAAPTRDHADLAMFCMKEGIHVLVEKPIAATPEEGAAMCECAKKNGVTLAVGHIERFNPALVMLEQRIRRGPGIVYRIDCKRWSPYGGRIVDTGVVLDMGIHDIDIVLNLMAPELPQTLYGETQTEISTKGYEDIFHGTMRYHSTIATFDVNWQTPKKVRQISVLTQLGLYECNLLSQELVFYENATHVGNWEEQSILQGVSEGDIHGFRIKREEPLKRELEDFVAAVRGGKEPLVTGESAVETLRVAHLFLQSSNESRVIGL